MILILILLINISNYYYYYYYYYCYCYYRRATTEAPPTRSGWCSGMRVWSRNFTSPKWGFYYNFTNYDFKERI